MKLWLLLFQVLKLCLCGLLLSIFLLLHYTLTSPLAPRVALSQQLVLGNWAQPPPLAQWRGSRTNQDQMTSLRRVLNITEPATTPDSLSRPDYSARSDNPSRQAVSTRPDISFRPDISYTTDTPSPPDSPSRPDVSTRPDSPSISPLKTRILLTNTDRVRTVNATIRTNSTVMDGSPGTVMDGSPGTVMDGSPGTVGRNTNTPPASPELTTHERHTPSSSNPPSILNTNNATDISLPSSHSPPLIHSRPHSLPNRVPNGGHILAINLYEQLTMASGNLLQLQCWASMLNMSVIKPFSSSSELFTPLDDTKHSKMLKFSDLFNESHWSQHARDHGYLPLVDWAEWVHRGPRKVIVVQLKYPVLSAVKRKRKEGVIFPHPVTGQAYKEGCAYKFMSGKYLRAIQSKGFRVVRKVCFNFLNGDEFTLKEFSNHIFGPYSPSDVSVIMDEWRGLGEPQRVLISDKICIEEHPYRERTPPSERLLRDAQRYIQTHLSGGDYVAVIARFEMTGLTRQTNIPTDQHAEIPFCIARTLKDLQQLKADSNTTTTFLSIDIGKYGSISFVKKKYYGHLANMEEFVSDVYEGKQSLSDLERQLEQTSSSSDRGYIAMLQQLIVTRAKCVLFMGGGSFQRHALHTYLELHPNKEVWCVRVVKRCTSAYRPIDLHAAV